MRQSVDLYAEIYEQDKDLQDLTRASMEEWKNGGTGSRFGALSLLLFGILLYPKL